MFAWARSWRRVAVASTITTFFLLILTLHNSDYLSRRPARLFPGSDSIYDDNDGNDAGSYRGSPYEVELKGGEGEVEGAHGSEEHGHGVLRPEDHEVELVVASIKSEDTSWFHTYLPDWHKNIYVADDAMAPLTVPKNKGREAMVYLTYIIDRYDDLPQNVLFVHASRFAWHNDDPDYDALPTLLNFRLPYLRQQGYVNLRCVWVIGCPREIRPAHDATSKKDDEKLMAKHVYKQSFEELLPDVPVPEIVAVSCCSQFGVTRETIRSRPKADYVRFQDWLLGTPLDDALNGRIFEFAWHSQ